MFAVSEFLHGEMSFHMQSAETRKISPAFYIPGAEAFESGNISIDIFCQQFSNNDFALYHGIYCVQEDCILRIRPFNASLTCRLMLQGSLTEGAYGRLVRHLRGQVLLNYESTEDHVFYLKEKQVCEMLVVQLFPGFTLPGAITNRLSKKPLWAHYKILDAAEQLMKEPGKRDSLDALMKLVAAALANTGAKEFAINESQVDKLFDVKSQMQQQFQKKTNIRQWASKAQMNTTTFKYLFKEIFKETPYSYLLAMRLEAAKRLALERPELGWTAIAERCGFGNYNNLRRLFYTKEKLTLTAWRKLKSLFQMLIASDLLDTLAFSI
jgi:AraC-like DNA-binding protein